MAELSPRNWAGWLHTCFSFVSVARITPLRWMPSADSMRLVQLLDDGRVERRLLLRQVAEDLHLQLVGQVGDDAASVFRRRSMNGAGQALEAGRRRRGPARPGSGTKKRRAEFGLRAQQAGVEELHDRPQVADVVLDRRAGQGDAVVGREGPRRLGLLGLGVLDVLGLVQDHARPVDLLEELEVAVQQSE